MNPDEIKKKDWQLLTAYSEISTLSYLKTIMENQAVIISELTKTPHKDVLENMNKYQMENYEAICNVVKKNIPDYK